jgi:hypothetical protein
MKGNWFNKWGGDISPEFIKEVMEALKERLYRGPFTPNTGLLRERVERWVLPPSHPLIVNPESFTLSELEVLLIPYTGGKEENLTVLARALYLAGMAVFLARKGYNLAFVSAGHSGGLTMFLRVGNEEGPQTDIYITQEALYVYTEENGPPLTLPEDILKRTPAAEVAEGLSKYLPPPTLEPSEREALVEKLKELMRKLIANFTENS